MDEYQRKIWDTSEYIGEELYIMVVDESTGGFGHINVDDFNVPVKVHKSTNPTNPPTPTNPVNTDSPVSNGVTQSEQPVIRIGKGRTPGAVSGSKRWKELFKD